MSSCAVSCVVPPPGPTHQPDLETGTAADTVQSECRPVRKPAIVLVLVGLLIDVLLHNIGPEASGLQPGGVYHNHEPTSKIGVQSF